MFTLHTLFPKKKLWLVVKLLLHSSCHQCVTAYKQGTVLPIANTWDEATGRLIEAYLAALLDLVAEEAESLARLRYGHPRWAHSCASVV